MLYLQMLRVNNWVKNIFILFPIVFSNQVFNFQLYPKLIVVFICFSLASSLIYIINDIKDKDSDKNHPVKKQRPMALGLISIKKSIYVCVLLMIIICSLMLVYKLYLAMVPIFVYVILNIVYSLKLKYIPILDVMCIALGFILRVISGAIAINVKASSWILLVTFFLSLYLGFGKRLREFSLEYNSKRAVMQYYSKDLLLLLLNTSSALFLISYTIYIVVLTSVWNQSYYSFISVILVIIGFFRYHFILFQDTSYGDPTDILLSDKWLWLTGSSYFLLMIWILR